MNVEIIVSVVRVIHITVIINVNPSYNSYVLRCRNISNDKMYKKIAGKSAGSQHRHNTVRLIITHFHHVQ